MAGGHCASHWEALFVKVRVVLRNCCVRVIEHRKLMVQWSCCCRRRIVRTTNRRDHILGSFDNVPCNERSSILKPITVDRAGSFLTGLCISPHIRSRDRRCRARSCGLGLKRTESTKCWQRIGMIPGDIVAWSGIKWWKSVGGQKR